MPRSVRTMTHLRRPSAITTLLLALASPMVTASEPGVHSHGTAQLQVAREGETLDILFETPAYNLVGFEHSPKNAAQEQAVVDATAWLAETPLLDTAKTDCKVTAASVSHGLGSPDTQASDDHHDHHDGQGHGEHHADREDHHQGGHGNHDHGHGDAHENEAGNVHSEFEVAQQLACAGLEQEKALASPLFERFKALEQLQVEWVSSDGQGSARLQSTADKFEFEP